MKIIYITLSLAFLCLTGNTYAQSMASSPGELKAQLSQSDGGTGSRVTVTESPELAQILNRTERNTGEIEVFRINIFSDNTQQGREKARQALNRFESAFPGVPARQFYVNPDWKVEVGNCLTQDEAAKLFGQVKALFSSAIVRTVRIPFSEFQRASSMVSSLPETTEVE